MPRAWFMFLVLLAVSATTSAAPALKDRPAKEPPITGEWVRVGHTESGTPVAPDRDVHHQVFTADGEWQYSYGARPDGTKGKSYVADPKQSPATIDIHMSASGKPNWRGIYKVEGDTLTLCLVTGDRDRPKVFESTADHPTTIWVFKRVKSKD